MQTILHNKLMAEANKSSGREQAPVQREGVRRKRGSASPASEYSIPSEDF